ncbi:hypothetical protein L228DRAFT_210766 [Xylona heveae TC161]|uniref:Probable endonuclease LCL3 n=1 Tax=Xylona heveae (strain CBS 132557 / TC161) TaxID=1328760 RepID=A0A165H478_XYLHT|nr:hypothetical protein L228DRAFT_210766 [Xylona heveae TC161]KZF22963.1 hypothetical protein L228DRAFT_210766 [Xylona heveae TC161]
MPLSQAKVKSVTSGDTLVLSNVHNPSQERILSLAFVSAPRIRREGDEPFAFESRDYLRRLLVGKVIQFTVIYTVPTGVKRDYGLVFLPSGHTLPELLVSEGWLRLRDDAERKGDSEESVAQLEKLRAAEAGARAQFKGVWAASGGKLDNIYEVPDPKAFVDEWKGKTIDSIVERVLTGDRLIVRLMVTPTQHVQTLLLIAGVRTPTTKRTNPADGKELPAEPFGEEAQQFVESRLLQRNVKVDLLGVSPQGQLVGTVIHPNGNISEFLLKSGLARCTDHHSTMLGSQMAALRQAERAAREQRQGLFQGLVSTKANNSRNIEATVVRVQSADTVFLRNKAGEEKRVNLSSIRQPKPTDPKQSPFAADAKEFLRKRLIGKHVLATIDGKRPATEGYEEREMATLLLNNKNVALTLVENGYASVIRHRRDDEDRSEIYDDLLAAEEAAQAEQRGMWSPKPPANKQYQDYSETLQKAKIQASVLQRQKRVPAIVDFVKSGSRFTVLIPRENARLTFVLSGIRAPRSARGPEDKAEPFGQEAHEFANRRCMQRDVEIDVETTDKVGGFIGTLYVNRENFAKLLLEEGLASVHAYSAEQSGNAKEYFAAEQHAKDARKGMWHEWDPSQEVNDEEAGEAADDEAGNGEAVVERRKDYRDIVVTNVDDSVKLKVQQIGTGTAALTELMSAFRTFHLSNATSLPGAPKAGDFVAAKFTEDNEWYRARIRRNDRENQQAEVVYIDYGNSELVPWSRLRPLTQPQFLPSKLRPQAQDAVLSFLQFPLTSPEYLADAVAGVSAAVSGAQLVANVDHQDQDGTLHVTLFDPKSSASLEQSLNADFIADGLAMVPRKLKAWERAASDVLAGLKAREEEAKHERRGMWEYGDLTED